MLSLGGINLLSSFNSLANVGRFFGSYFQHSVIKSNTGGGQFLGGGILYPLFTCMRLSYYLYGSIACTATIDNAVGTISTAT